MRKIILKFLVLHKADNASLISSVSSKLDSLHADVAKEGALKEEIAQQASTIAVQKVQLD